MNSVRVAAAHAASLSIHPFRPYLSRQDIVVRAEGVTRTWWDIARLSVEWHSNSPRGHPVVMVGLKRQGPQPVVNAAGSQASSVPKYVKSGRESSHFR